MKMGSVGNGNCYYFTFMEWEGINIKKPFLYTSSIGPPEPPQGSYRTIAAVACVRDSCEK